MAVVIVESPAKAKTINKYLGKDLKKQLSDIAAACKGTDKLILATDPDREGEAISWHLLEALYKRRALKKDVPVERVVFNAITKTAVTQAMKEPREVDMELSQRRVRLILRVASYPSTAKSWNALISPPRKTQPAPST